MEFKFTEEQKMIRDTARNFAMKELAHDAIERDEKAIFPEKQVKKMGELGFMGIMTPPEYGGAGMDAISYCLMIEELAKVDASAAVIASVNNSLVCHVFEKFANEEQKQKFLVPLAEGKKLGAYALSEPQSGSDASNMRVTAVLEGDNYRVNGTKNFITNGANADIAILFATTDKTIGTKGIIALVAEKNMQGYSVGKKEDKLGIRSSDTVQLIFEDCLIPVANRLGEEGDGFKIAMNTLDGGRIGVASQALGIAQGALERAVKYAKEREAFGKPIANHQAIQFKLANMATEIEAARLLIYQSAFKKDCGEPYGKYSAMAKLHASRTAMKVTTEAVQIFGGYGCMREYEVERFMRDAKITEIYEGTSEIQQLVIGRAVTKEY